MTIVPTFILYFGLGEMTTSFTQSEYWPSVRQTVMENKQQDMKQFISTIFCQSIDRYEE